MPLALCTAPPINLSPSLSCAWLLSHVWCEPGFLARVRVNFCVVVQMLGFLERSTGQLLFLLGKKKLEPAVFSLLGNGKGEEMDALLGAGTEG